VIVDADCQVIGGMGGQVPGQQTVNRGELFAATLAFELTTGHLDLITDSAFVCRPFAEDRDDDSGPPKFHLDLWGRIAAAKATRTTGHRVLKVKSHRSVEQVWSARADVRHWLGNEAADAVALWAAGVWCLPPMVVEQVQALGRKTARVHDRFATIMEMIGDKGVRMCRAMITFATPRRRKSSRCRPSPIPTPTPTWRTRRRWLGTGSGEPVLGIQRVCLILPL